MSWWQTRKARKELEKHNIPGLDVGELSRELKQGYKQAKQVRKELRKQESPEYRKMIKTINQIIDGTAPVEQKKQISYLLVEQAKFSDWEKNDLLEQLERIYGPAAKN